MFKIEIDNKKIGTYLDEQIRDKYPSRRAFCRAYLIARDKTDLEESLINNMSNRLAQIVKGNKAIQILDLPYFSKMLDISCEQLLSAGEYAVPLVKRATNYSIACSQDPKEWEDYIRHPDKPFLNADEYGKTVLDYALKFQNYAFIKYLMDHKYIWFDCEENNQYFENFGAGTSIEHRRVDKQDWGLETALWKDTLRLNLIALAADNQDLQMLDALRAREIPQLYNRAHYLYSQLPSVESSYNEKMVKHIAKSNEVILGYFTDSFDISENLPSPDGKQHRHTFIFPYISKLLDFLICQKSSFAKEALKKALAHNKNTYKALCDLTAHLKNDAYYAADYMKGVYLHDCQSGFSFDESDDFVIFRPLSPVKDAKGQSPKIVTNVARVTKEAVSSELRQLVDELNASYDQIKAFREHLNDM